MKIERFIGILSILFQRERATAPELQAILAGLRSLDSASCTRRYARLMEKLSAGTGGLMPGGAPIAHRPLLLV